jgi:IMP cyclohydrolase
VRDDNRESKFLQLRFRIACAIYNRKTVTELEALATKEYPGRLIIIGVDQTGESKVVVYAITGRSPSSQARKLELRGDTVWAVPTGDEVIKKGNVDLLVYPAIFFSRGIAVSNGKQTDDIKACFKRSQDPKEVLKLALKKWDYEPDPPAYTPRISGCVLPRERAALSIINRAPDGSSIKRSFYIPLKAGQGKMISTYEGENTDPLPSFRGEPIDVGIKGKNAESMAEVVYKALGPKPGKNDFRVAVCCVFFKNLGQEKYQTCIINKHERK